MTSRSCSVRAHTRTKPDEAAEAAKPEPIFAEADQRKIDHMTQLLEAALALDIEAFGESN